MPDTDIMLFETKLGAGHVDFNKGKNITARKGYDNQPCFSPDGQFMLFVSISETDSTQSDVWMYDIQKKSKKQITNTKESEYSPTFSDDGKLVYVVRVDADSGQRLYSMPWPQMNSADLIARTDSVGYFCLIGTSKIAMFLVGSPNRLVILDRTNGEQKFICNEPGRCIKMSPKKKDLIYFIEKRDSVNWYLNTYNVKTNKTLVKVKMIKGSEDFAFLKDGTLVSGFMNNLFRLNPAEQGWVGDSRFDEMNVPPFKRIAADKQGNHIAVVFTSED